MIKVQCDISQDELKEAIEHILKNQFGLYGKKVQISMIKDTEGVKLEGDLTVFFELVNAPRA